MVAVTDRSASMMMPIIMQYIRPGKSIMFDEWRAYNGIGAAVCMDTLTNHSLNFVDPKTSAYTQRIERS